MWNVIRWTAVRYEPTTIRGSAISALSGYAKLYTKHIVFGLRLDERDGLRRESPRLATRSGRLPPDDIEEIAIPAQQLLRVDEEQGVPSSAPRLGQTLCPSP